VVFLNITSLPNNLGLAVVSANDAVDMHSETTGAGMDIPDTDIAGTSRGALIDCGAFEAESGVVYLPDIVTANPYIQMLSIIPEASVTINDITTGAAVVGDPEVICPSVPRCDIEDVLSGDPEIGKPIINKPITATPGERTVKVPAQNDSIIVPRIG
jgi:hypothetical protein